MDATIAAVPILPGAADALKQLSQDVAGVRSHDHNLSRQSLGVIRERWYTHEDEGLGFLLLEGPGARQAVSVFAAPQSEHQAWYMTKLAPALPMGIDWLQSFSAERLYSSGDGAEPMLQSSVLAFPLVPGCSESWRTLAGQAMHANKDSFDDYHARMGLREVWWLLREPEGEIALMSMESNDLVGAICGFADSQHIADLWLRQKYLEIQGIDWRGGIPSRMSQLAFDWSGAEQVIDLDRRATLLRRPQRAR